MSKAKRLEFGNKTAKDKQSEHSDARTEMLAERFRCGKPHTILTMNSGGKKPPLPLRKRTVFAFVNDLVWMMGNDERLSKTIILTQISKMIVKCLSHAEPPSKYHPGTAHQRHLWYSSNVQNSSNCNQIPNLQDLKSPLVDAQGKRLRLS